MSGLPIADAPLLGRAARRQRLVRAALTGALALLIAIAVVLAARARSGGVAVASAAGGATTEIVLDVSGSVNDSAYASARRALQQLGRSRVRVGLILFSDSAVETLPPGSPASHLVPFARAIAAVGRPQRSEIVYRPPDVAPNPWYPSFSGGTRMSAGLAAAREALARDGARGSVLLISDLGDAPDDRGQLRRELITLARTGVELRVLALPNALARDRTWFAKLEGPAALRPDLPAIAAPRPRSHRSSVPLALAMISGLLALGLAANELFATSLRWRAAR